VPYPSLFLYPEFDVLFSLNIILLHSLFIQHCGLCVDFITVQIFNSVIAIVSKLLFYTFPAAKYPIHRTF